MLTTDNWSQKERDFFEQECWTELFATTYIWRREESDPNKPALIAVSSLLFLGINNGPHLYSAFSALRRAL